MDQRSLAISILQNARDALAERLSQRIIESRQEIEEDASGGSYLSEIETVYDQIGGRLAHVNAMLSNLPPAPATTGADTAASEIVYADLASGQSSALDAEAMAPLTLLALPAPPHGEEPPADPLVDAFASIVLHARAGDATAAAQAIAELFDIKPSQARRAALAFQRQAERFPEVAQRIERLGAVLAEMNEYAAATLLSEGFDFQPLDALLLARALKSRAADAEVAD